MEKGKDFTSAKGDDNVMTPHSITEQFLEKEEFDYNKSVLEPASGDGDITSVLMCKFNRVTCYDLNRGSGLDFLDQKEKHDYIITNPPYSQLDKFIKKGKEVARIKFAFLCKITHLGSVKRFAEKTFLDPDYPLTKIYLFTRQANLRFFDKEKELNILEHRNRVLFLETIKSYCQKRKSILKQIDYPKIREDGKYPAGMYYYVWLVWENMKELRDNYCDDFITWEEMKKEVDSSYPVFQWINNDKYILRKGDK